MVLSFFFFGGGVVSLSALTIFMPERGHRGPCNKDSCEICYVRLGFCFEGLDIGSFSQAIWGYIRPSSSP